MFQFVILLLAVTSVFSEYNPETDNVYHIFTRTSSSGNQILTNSNRSLINTTDFDPLKPIVVIIHGWNNSIISPVFEALLPAFLGTGDENVIAVDWSAGSKTIYTEAFINNIRSASAVAAFLTWLNNVTGANLSQYLIVGHSLGAHQAGMIGRKMNSSVPYIVGLDAAEPGFEGNDNRLKPSDGMYTEAIHTNAGVLGYMKPLVKVDIYVNGGTNQPGCGLDVKCDHARAFLYFAESIISGGFNSVGCSSYKLAMAASCILGNTTNINMGGRNPKTGSTGIYYCKTNADSPYSQS